MDYSHRIPSPVFSFSQLFFYIFYFKEPKKQQTVLKNAMGKLYGY